MSVSQTHSRLVNAVKKSRRDPSARAEVEQARRQLAEAKLAAYIQRVVDEVPPLSADARQRLAALLGSRGARQ